VSTEKLFEKTYSQGWAANQREERETGVMPSEELSCNQKGCALVESCLIGERALGVCTRCCGLGLAISGMGGQGRSGALLAGPAPITNTCKAHSTVAASWLRQ